MFFEFLSISAPGTILVHQSWVLQYLSVSLTPSKSTELRVASFSNCARLCSIHETWIGEPEPETGSVSKRSTKSILSISKKYLLHRRYQKPGSPNQIESQKLVPNLYLDTAQPCCQVKANLSDINVYYDVEGCIAKHLLSKVGEGTFFNEQRSLVSVRWQEDRLTGGKTQKSQKWRGKRGGGRGKAVLYFM